MDAISYKIFKVYIEDNFKLLSATQKFLVKSFRILSVKNYLHGLFMMIPTFRQIFKHELQVKILASKGKGGKE